LKALSAEEVAEASTTAAVGSRIAAVSKDRIFMVVVCDANDSKQQRADEDTETKYYRRQTTSRRRSEEHPNPIDACRICFGAKHIVEGVSRSHKSYRFTKKPSCALLRVGGSSKQRRDE